MDRMATDRLRTRPIVCLQSTFIKDPHERPKTLSKPARRVLPLVMNRGLQFDDSWGARLPNYWCEVEFFIYHPAASRRRVRLLRGEKVVPHDVIGHLSTENIPLHHGMMVMHAAINTGCVHFSNYLFEAGEVMGGMSHVTCDHIENFVGSEKSRKCIHEGLGSAAVGSWVLGVPRSGVERDPVGVSDRIRISIRIRVVDGSIRTPESELILRAEAGGERIGQGYVGYRSESSRISGSEMLACNQVAKRTSVLGCWMIRPK